MGMTLHWELITGTVTQAQMHEQLLASPTQLTTIAYTDMHSE